MRLQDEQGKVYCSRHVPPYTTVRPVSHGTCITCRAMGPLTDDEKDERVAELARIINDNDEFEAAREEVQQS